MKHHETIEWCLTGHNCEVVYDAGKDRYNWEVRKGKELQAKGSAVTLAEARSTAMSAYQIVRDGAALSR